MFARTAPLLFRRSGQVLVETLFWAPLFAGLAAATLWFGRLWIWRMRLAAEVHRAVFMRVHGNLPPSEIEARIRQNLAGGPLRKIRVRVSVPAAWGPVRGEIRAEFPAPVRWAGQRGIRLREEAACFDDSWILGFPSGLSRS